MGVDDRSVLAYLIQSMGPGIFWDTEKITLQGITKWRTRQHQHREEYGKLGMEVVCDNGTRLAGMCRRLRGVLELNIVFHLLVSLLSFFLHYSPVLLLFLLASSACISA